MSRNYEFKTDMTAADAAELFVIGADGELYWRKKIGNRQNKSGPGVLAGNQTNGHRWVTIGRKSYQVPRLIWLLHYGEWPLGRVRFHDGNSLNVAVSNLYVPRIPGKFDQTTLEGKREYERAHRAARPELHKNRRLLGTYGITLAQYDEMLAEQGGKCAICRGAEPGARWKGSPYFSVDHCHTTGKVRGLLCAECNKGLGHFKDETISLIRAAEYVRRHQAPTNVIPFPSGKDSTAPAEMARAS